jgi:hypothetical protein
VSTLDDRPNPAVIADYLAQLRPKLQASPEKEQEILREMRSHLLLATQEVGERSALERFGSARDIGQELRQIHGRATWGETALAALPLLVLSLTFSVSITPRWTALALIATPAACIAAWAIWVRHARWPLWAWAWIGCLPLTIPNAPPTPLWGALAYLVVLLFIRRRNWLEGTLALYPLPTVWAFYRTVLPSPQVQTVGWTQGTLSLLSTATTLAWVYLLAHMLRTPSGQARIGRALGGQVVVFALHTLLVVAARLWPTYPAPYPYTVEFFVKATLPYGLINGLPYLLFALLTSLPAIVELARTRAEHGPPSRPAWS